ARSAGSAPQRLTDGSFIDMDGVAWSPDRRSLAFRARTPGTRSRIYLISSAGGTPKMLLPGDAEQGLRGGRGTARALSLAMFQNTSAYRWAARLSTSVVCAIAVSPTCKGAKVSGVRGGHRTAATSRP